MVLVDYIGIFLHFRILLTDDCTCIQYWCIDGKYIIYVARLRNGWGGASFSESFHPFRAELH